MVSVQRFLFTTTSVLVTLAANALSKPSTSGIEKLAGRLFHGQNDAFEFVLTVQHENWSRWNMPLNDNYTVKAAANGKILVQGTTLNALARGLRHYANEVLDMDRFLFVDTYKTAPSKLPAPKEPLTGASVVPWRYNLNTVTFSYTFAWYQWEDWERFLDWAALRGVNLQLAWVGYEKIFLDSFRDLGLSDEDIIPFFSGPVFQSWNRFGNIQGSWGGKGDLPVQFIEQQFDLQKKIVARMVELGMTPVLPAFPGFVPQTIKKARPNAKITVISKWFNPGPDEYTHDWFLDPMDDVYAELQNLFISKQIDAFGNVTNIYTLDQFNEMSPASGDTDYLSGVSRSTYAGLTAANPAAVWLLQGWLFYSSRDFWTQDRIDAYLGGVPSNQDMLLLDLYSEIYPQWQRTNSYSGKQWIWCQLHDFGGNMALEGRVQSITVNPIDALAHSESLVGFGLTPEGFEGNEIVYDILLDQAWSSTPIDTSQYFKTFTTKRYAGVPTVPDELYKTWELLRTNIYSNTRADIPQVPVATYQLRPALSGIVNRTGHFPHPTALHYDPAVLQEVWRLMLRAALEQLSLWQIPTFQLDFVDVTRQVITNAFDEAYINLIAAFKCSKPPSEMRELRRGEPQCDVAAAGQRLLYLLTVLDKTLLANDHFSLQNWTEAAREWGSAAGNEDLFTFNARSIVTVWQVDATSLSDYAARAWAGVVGSYYYGRWSIFVDALVQASSSGQKLDQDALNSKLRNFEVGWQDSETTLSTAGANVNPPLKDVMKGLQTKLPDLFATSS